MRSEVEKWSESAIAASDRENVRALIIDELRRLHEGTLARYNLRLEEFQRWKK